MHILLPYPSFAEAVGCLDDTTLLEQRNNAKNVYNAIERGRSSGYRNNHLVIKWRNHKNALALYHNFTLFAWLERGYSVKYTDFLGIIFPVYIPEWVKNKEIQEESRRILLEKNPDYYAKFNWGEDR